MKKAAIFLWILILTPIAYSQVSEPVKKLNDKTLCFYSGFNQQSLDADIASGTPLPKTKGEAEFKKGVFGQAVYLKKGMISYFRKDNMPLANSTGTLCFWYCPVSWDLSSDNQPNNIIFRANVPYSGISRTGLKKKPNGQIRCYSGLVYYIYRELGGKKKNDGLGIHSDKIFKNNKWIFIALRWNKSKMILTINAASPGTMSVSKNFSSPIAESEVQVGAEKKTDFSFSMPEPALLDEVMIFTRLLSDQELKFIYQSLQKPAE
jgi:hypothetical protein